MILIIDFIVKKNYFEPIKNLYMNHIDQELFDEFENYQIYL